MIQSMLPLTGILGNIYFIASTCAVVVLVTAIALSVRRRRAARKRRATYRHARQDGSPPKRNFRACCAYGQTKTQQQSSYRDWSVGPRQRSARPGHRVVGSPTLGEGLRGWVSCVISVPSAAAELAARRTGPTLERSGAVGTAGSEAGHVVADSAGYSFRPPVRPRSHERLRTWIPPAGVWLSLAASSFPTVALSIGTPSTRGRSGERKAAQLASHFPNLKSPTKY